jgi:tRNA uridine 5-carboxymethylaminomethyl modification enzyme
MQKLQLHKPQTLGQASRISGITPVDIALVSVALEKARGNSQGMH